MTAPTYQADLARLTQLLESWIDRRATTDVRTWLREKRDEIAAGAPDWRFFTSFSAAPRYLGKAELDLDETELAAAASVRSGWNPARWSIDEAARTLLVLTVPHEEPEVYLRTLDRVFSTADIRESVALYQSLPLFPYPERFRARASEGVRSNMTSVFDAVALENPYPAEFLDDTAWNQMVLKAVFIGSPLFRIQGLDRRANATLARMLVDFAHERWAASRPVTPELWRPVGPFAGDDYLDELDRVLGSDDETEREAAALALAAAGSKGAAALLAKHPDLKDRIDRDELTWEAFSRHRMPVPA